MPHLKSQSEAKNVHGGEGGVGGVGVSQLEDLDEDQHHHDVHHGRVELEADVGGTNMEDHTEEPLHMKILINYLWTYDLFILHSIFCILCSVFCVLYSVL